MSGDLNQLEREAEDLLAALADNLSVTPGKAAMQRVRAGMHHELNEHWLAEKPVPLPPAETLHRVRAAVSAELGRTGSPRFIVRHPGWTLAAAAAAVGICLGVAHVAGWLETPSATELLVEERPPPTDPEDETQMDLFVAAAEDVWADDDLTESIRDELEAVEGNLADWQTGGEDAVAQLIEIMDEIDELLEQGDPDNSTSQRDGRPRGALG